MANGGIEERKASFVRAALEQERRDESGGRKREPGDRWPFQTMRNSGDKGGARAKIRGERRREERSLRKEGGRERWREGGGYGGKIGGETTFSTKRRGECNERWGKAEREGKKKRAREGEEGGRVRSGDSGEEKDGKRVTQTENGPCGQFLGTINDEPTEKERKAFFFHVYSDMFRYESHLTLLLSERVSFPFFIRKEIGCIRYKKINDIANSALMRESIPAS